MGPLSFSDRLEVLTAGRCTNITDVGFARFCGAAAAASYGSVVEALGDVSAMLGEAQADGAVTAHEAMSGMAGKLAHRVIGEDTAATRMARGALPRSICHDSTLRKGVKLHSKPLHRLYAAAHREF